VAINTGSVVEFHIPANLPLPFHLNCFQNGKICFLLQLTGLIDICQMLTDGGYLNSKKLGHGLLRKPDSFVFYVTFTSPEIILGGRNLSCVKPQKDEKPSCLSSFREKISVSGSVKAVI